MRSLLAAVVKPVASARPASTRLDVGATASRGSLHLRGSSKRYERYSSSPLPSSMLLSSGSLLSSAHHSHYRPLVMSSSLMPSLVRGYAQDTSSTTTTTTEQESHTYTPPTPSLDASNVAAPNTCESYLTELAPVEDVAWYAYPKHLIVDGLLAIHDATGLPWWATILTTTVTVRLLLFPIVLNSAKNASKMQALKPELEALNQKFSV
jgi:membrane protein insertase Oxa1/YidC/SpoIIIJ